MASAFGQIKGELVRINPGFEKGRLQVDRARSLAWGTSLPAALLFAACLTSAWAQTASNVLQRHPDVVAVKTQSSGENTFNFDVTVSSPYDTPQRYADAIRVMSKEGRVFAERKLLHDHADEQPFTRDLYWVVIPQGMQTVIVQARDRQFGYGGKTVEVKLPGR